MNKCKTCNKKTDKQYCLGCWEDFEITGTRPEDTVKVMRGWRWVEMPREQAIKEGYMI